MTLKKLPYHDIATLLSLPVAEVGTLKRTLRKWRPHSTKREFRKRIGEHLRDIANKRDTPVAIHMNQFHQGNPSKINFVGIDRIIPPLRGGDWDKQILQKETRWIFMLKTVQPLGLNETQSYSCFL